jgi:hypothetical protein
MCNFNEYDGYILFHKDGYILFHIKNIIRDTLSCICVLCIMFIVLVLSFIIASCVVNLIYLLKMLINKYCFIENTNIIDKVIYYYYSQIFIV